MFSHSGIWKAIDKLAQKKGLSPSGLAKLAGLDATTFNKSKRFSKDGRERWPSTASIAKILEVTSESTDSFFATEINDASPLGFSETSSNQLPLMGMAQAGSGGFFDDGGYPAGNGWDEVDLPDIKAEGDYALRISGDSMLPVYREGDVIVVTMNTSPRPGDRVVLKTIDGEVMAKLLLAKSETAATLMSFNTDFPTRMIELTHIDWMARITWASQ